MKKLFVVALALVMMLAMATTVFAETEGLREESTSVTVTYQPGELPEDVYAIDIIWESFDFTYVQAAQVWNPTTHTYEDDENGVSGWEKATANVVITNNSNIDVIATVAYVAGETANGTASASLTAGAGANTLAAATEGAPTSVTATLTVTGVPAVDANEAVIGMVTVTLTGIILQ